MSENIAEIQEKDRFKKGKCGNPNGKLKRAGHKAS